MFLYKPANDIHSTYRSFDKLSGIREEVVNALLELGAENYDWRDLSCFIDYIPLCMCLFIEIRSVRGLWKPYKS